MPTWLAKNILLVLQQSTFREILRSIPMCFDQLHPRIKISTVDAGVLTYVSDSSSSPKADDCVVSKLLIHHVTANDQLLSQLSANLQYMYMHVHVDKRLSPAHCIIR